MNELRAVVRAKLAKEPGVRVADDVCAPRASTVRMDASIHNSLILWKTWILGCLEESIQQLDEECQHTSSESSLLSNWWHVMRSSLAGKDYEECWRLLEQRFDSSILCSSSKLNVCFSGKQITKLGPELRKLVTSMENWRVPWSLWSSTSFNTYWTNHFSWWFTEWLV